METCQLILTIVLVVAILEKLCMQTEDNKNIKLIMNSIKDLTEKVDALQVSLDNEQAEIAKAIEGLQATVAELNVLVADGGTAEQRQALADKLDAIQKDLQATIPDTVEETTTETTTEV